MNPGTRLIVIAAVIGAIAGCYDVDGPAGPGDAVLVDLLDGAFSPETATVAQGKSVRWTNRGAQVHAVASDSADFEAMALAPTWWTEYRFDTVGIYNVRCSIHDTEHGAVIVQ
jgi:plastocyanin